MGARFTTHIVRHQVPGADNLSRGLPILTRSIVRQDRHHLGLQLLRCLQQSTLSYALVRTVPLTPVTDGTDRQRFVHREREKDRSVGLDDHGESAGCKRLEAVFTRSDCPAIDTRLTRPELITEAVQSSDCQTPRTHAFALYAVFHDVCSVP